jgi:hypothetical protein
MKSRTKNKGQKNPLLSTQKSGEELLEELWKGSYDDEDIGKSFIIIGSGRLSQKKTQQGIKGNNTTSDGGGAYERHVLQ